MESDLVLLSDQLAEKEKELRNEIENKVQNHRRWNQNHIDLTTYPLSPVHEQGMELKFRPARTQYLMTPPASVSDSMDIDEEVQESTQVVNPHLGSVFQFKAGGASSEQLQANQPSFRRRIGRLSRLWIDRRGMSTSHKSENNENSDRWKYDSDDSDDDVEPLVYEVDPYDTPALKFRATIPLSSYLFRGRPAVPHETLNGPTRSLPAAIPPVAIPSAALPSQQVQVQTASAS